MTKQERDLRYSFIVSMVCVLLGVVMLGCVIISSYTHSEPDTTVIRNCWVYETYDDATVLEDTNGNLWEVGTRITDIDRMYEVVFDTQGTDTLLDDVVTDILWTH